MEQDNITGQPSEINFSETLTKASFALPASLDMTTIYFVSFLSLAVITFVYLRRKRRKAILKL